MIPDILEQAGISWPIRNPLYLTADRQEPQMSRLPGSQVNWPSLSQPTPSIFTRQCNTDPFVRPSTDPPPPSLPQFPRPMMGGRSRRPAFWDSSLEDSSYDDLSMDSWSKRTSSHSTRDASMPDMLYASPVFGHSGDAWMASNTPHNYQAGKDNVGQQTRRGKGARQVVVTLQEDQLGQLV